jgi:hypothetical protein
MSDRVAWTDRPIAYRPVLAKAFGGVKAGVFLSQLLYWDGKGDDPDWTFKTAENFEDETGLTRKEQEGARRSLKACGVLIEELHGVPPTLWFRVDFDVLNDVVSNFPQTSNLNSPKRRNQIRQKGEILPLRTESTPESTHGEPTQGSLDSEDPKPWPDWYATLWAIPGFKFSLPHCQRWLDDNGVPVEIATMKALALKGKWPGPKKSPYTDAWANFRNWVLMAMADRPNAPEAPQRRPSGFGGG